jgi:hypothetical protein
VIKTQTNVKALSDLLTSAGEALKEGHHTHIGSTCLWNRHTQALARMNAKLDTFNYREVGTPKYRWVLQTGSGYSKLEVGIRN